MVELIVAVSAATLISAFCSLLEAVLYSVPLSHIEALAQSGRTSGRILRKLRQEVDRPLSAILSLNTIAHTAGAAIAGAAAADVFGHRSLITELYFPAFFILIILLLSEVMPKTVGVIHSRTLAVAIARPLQLLVWILTPMIWLCRLATRVVSRQRADQAISGGELIVMARMGQQIGAIEADEAQVIQNILALKSRTTRDVMTPRTVIFALSEHLTVEEAHEEAGIWAHTRVPVYDRDAEDIVGIVLRRDVLTARTKDRGRVKLSELMRPVHFIAESTSLDRVLNMFLERRQHLFVVIDEYGGLAGVISLEDVLEEILGKEIIDELDQVADMRKLARRQRRQILRGSA